VSQLTISFVSSSYSRAPDCFINQCPMLLVAFVCSAYIVWYEVGSHSGKPVPTVSFFPPLSPLYNAIWPIDRSNIKFHEVRHFISSFMRCATNKAGR
jgi:hypothetical protein